MPSKRNTFGLKKHLEKIRKRQTELQCVIVDVEKVNDRLQREELWFACDLWSGREECWSRACMRAVREWCDEVSSVVRGGNRWRNT